MLYKKFQPQSFPGSGVLSVFTIYGHGGQLTQRAMTISTDFPSPFNRRLHMKFEENLPRVQGRSRSKV